MSTETYSLSVDFGGNLRAGQFQTEVNADGGIAPNCTSVTQIADVVSVNFDASLSAGEQTTLDGLVASHTPALPPIIEIDSTGTDGTTATVTVAQTSNITITLPTSSDTLIGESSTNTLTNKTLSSPIISGDITFDEATNDLTLAVTDQTTGTATVTIPDLSGVSGDIVITNATQTLTNKTLTSATLTLPQINDTSEDHQYIFAVNELTADRTVTLPLLTANDTFVFEGFTQTLTNKTLTSATLSTPTISGDITFDEATNDLTLAVTDQATGTATATIPDLSGVSQDFIFTSQTQTLTNKTLTSPVLTLPEINDTSLDHQYIFAVNELTADRTITLPLLTGNDTFVFEGFTQTLTNKTISDATNTVGANELRTTSTSVVIDTAAAPTSGQVLTATSGTAATWQTPGSGGSTDYKDSVRVATTTSGTLASDFENGDTIDGVVLATNDRILIKNQASGIENGIYTVNASGAPTRASDFSSASAQASAVVFVEEGTINADSGWLCTNISGSDVVDTDALVFAQFDVVNTLSVSRGGTGATTLTSGNVLVGNGTSAVLTTKAAPTGDFVGTTDTQTLTNKTLTSPVLTLPEINDTSLDHQYVFAVNELTADRTITLPLLTANDTFVFEGHTQTLTNKTLTSAVLNIPTISGDVTFDEATNDLTLAVTDQATGTATATIPDFGGVSQDFVFTSLSQTLTNKTLTSAVLTLPEINDTSLDHQYIFAVNELTADRTITLPLLTANDTFVFEDHTQTLSNKTLSTPTISGDITFDEATNDLTLAVSDQGSGAATVTIPDLGGVSGDVVITNATQTLTNKTLTSAVLTLPQINDTSLDHQYIFAVNELTADRTVTLPLLTGNDTFVFEGFTQTLSNKTLSAPTVSGDITFDEATNDLTLAVTDQATGTATATIPDLGGVSQDFVFTSQTQTLSNKVLTLPQINDTSLDHQYVFAVSELVADRTVTLPLLTANDTFVFEGFTQTLTNKTLTSATLSTPTISGDVTFDEATNDLTLAVTDQATGTATATIPDLGGVSQDFVFTSQTQTLTNKTISDSTNTVGANELRTTSTSVVIDTAAAPTSGQVLTATSGTAATWQTPAAGGSADYKGSVRVATTTSGTLASDFENGDTVDGIVLATGNRILIKNQASGVENGIYTVNVSGAPTRTSDFASASGQAASIVFVEEGTVNGDTGWLCTNISGSDVVDTDALVFEQFDAVGILDVSRGGTGVATLTSGNVLVGNGTSAVLTTKAAPTGDFVGTTDTQTLTNKTLTSAVLTLPEINDTSLDHQYVFAVNELTADRTVTLPLLTGNDTFVFEDHTQTLTNKTLTSAILTLPQINDTSLDHQYIFAVSELVADRTITLPLLTANDTFVFESHTQTLSNKTLSTPTISGDITFDEATNDLTLAVTDQATGTATATIPDLSGVSQDFVFTSQTQTLTNKTLTSPVLTLPEINDTSLDHQYIFAVNELTADRTVTLPLLTGNDTFVFENHTQTLTNKTLTSPTVSTPTISGDVVFDEATNDLTLAVTDQATGTATATIPDLGGVSQDFVFTSLSQTLTNKTISDSTNTVGANEIRTTGASVVVDTAAPPTSGQILTATSATAAAWQTFSGGSADYKDSVRVATTTSGNLASDFENGDTVDGIVLATGNRILIKNQGTGSENGIYTVNASGAPTRTSDFASTSNQAGAAVFVEEGTTNADSGWLCTNNQGSDTVGTDALVFARFDAVGTLEVSRGGTGVSTLTSGNVLVGNGTSAVLTTKAAPTGDFVGTTDTQTLTNKTLTSPILTLPEINDTSLDHQYVFAVNELTADRTVTLPLLTGNDTFVFEDHTQTLTNKSLTSAVLTTPTISGDVTFDEATNDLTLAVTDQATGTATATIPDLGGVSGDIVITNTTQTLTNKTLTSATLTLPQINDTSLDHQYIFAVNELTADRTITLPLLTGNDTFVFEAHTQTLTNKTLTSPTVSTPTISGDITFDEATNDLTLAVTDQATGTATATIPDLSGVSQDFVFTSQTQTLTNKTLTSAVLTLPEINDTSLDHQYVFAVNELTADRTITLPLLTGNDTFVFEDHTQTLTNKTITSPTISTPTISGDITFDEATNDLTMAVTDQVTGTATATIPDLGGVSQDFVFTSLSQTLTNKTLTSAVLTLPQINDTSLDHQYIFAVNELTADRTVTLPLLTGNDTFVFEDHTQTLNNKTLSTPTISGDITFDEATNDLTMAVTDQVSGTATATIPDLGGVSQDFVFTSQTQTLTNKTLTSPVLTLPEINDTSLDHQYVFAVNELTADRTVTLPLLTGNDTFVFEAHTQTLTNKTISDASNTVGANEIRTTGASVVVDTAAPPAAGQILTATSATAATWQTMSGSGSGDYKDSVRVATTTSGTLASDFENGDTVDGIVLATNDRILIKNQASGVENGIYTVNASGAPTRTSDFASTSNQASAIVFAEEGTTNANTGWLCTNISGSDVVDTDALVFVRFDAVGTLEVSRGGTGATTLTSGNVLVGNGTSAVLTTKAAPTGDFAGTTDTQTLTNKTLTSPVLTLPEINDTSLDHQYVFAVNELTADRTVTLPLLTGNDTFVFEDHTQTLSNKTLTSAILTSPVLTTPEINDTSLDHQYVFAVNELTADRTVTLPLLTGNDTFVFEDHTQTLTNKTLTSAVLTSPVLTTPEINDTSLDHQYVFAVNELTADRTVTLPLLTGNDTFVFEAHTQTLTNKTLTSATLTTPIVSGDITFDEATNDLTLAVTDQATGTATATIPDLSGVSQDFVFTSQTQTLTNKTLTSPVLTLPEINDTSLDHQYIFGVNELTADRTITLPLLTGNDTFVFEAHTQTLTNKTISDASNTVGANEIRTTGTAVTVDASAAPAASGYALVTTTTTNATWQELDTVVVKKAVYTLNLDEITFNSASFVNVKYFLWDNSAYSGYTNGVVRFDCDIPGPEMEVRLFDDTGSTSLGSVTTSGSGIYTFSVTNPSVDSRLILQARRVSGGSRPSLFATHIDYDQ